MPFLTSGTGSGGPGMWPMRVGLWINDLPAHAVWAAHQVAGWWPWLVWAALLALAGGYVGLAVYRTVWRHAVAGGYWLAITPPWSVDPARDETVWRALSTLAARARGGWWRLVHPPLAFEILAEGGRLSAGLWLPGWVGYRAAAEAVSRAWPGAAVEPAAPPVLDRRAGPVVGRWLAATDRQTVWLVDDIAPRVRPARGTGADADLGSVLEALRKAGGPALLQVLVRPAPGRWVARLRTASVRPTTPDRTRGQRAAAVAVWLLLVPVRLVLAVFDLFFTHSTTGASSGVSRREPDEVERDQMRQARDKLKARPHLLVSIRLGALGHDRPAARGAASAVADGFGDTSRWLSPVRLRRPAGMLAGRLARHGEWLLLTAAELGVLAHLPADPARYGFATAALHRAAPLGAARALPERPGDTSPGWDRHGWGDPPADTSPASSPTRDHPSPRVGSTNPPPYTASDQQDAYWDDEDDDDPYE
jgi:hypothetical protein